MAYHKSSEKRIRQTKVRNELNKYKAKTMRNALKTLRSTTSKKERLLVATVSPCKIYRRRQASSVATTARWMQR